jgi:hypothetical protein
MTLGGLPPLIVFGVADWISWSAPFYSYFEAIRINLFEAKASMFGVKPPYWFVERVAQVWGGAFPILLALILARARRSKLWVGVALAIIASHSAIPHKEYRFIFPALACLIIVAAMATADLVRKLEAALPSRYAALLPAAAAAIWIAFSASLAFAPAFSSNWFRSRGTLEASVLLSRQSDMCGLLLYDHHWTTTGGYTYLHRNIPIYDLDFDHDRARRSTAAFNYILLKRSSVSEFEPEFRAQRCFGTGMPDDVCTIMRAGSCIRKKDIQPLLEQTGLGACVEDRAGC